LLEVLSFDADQSFAPDKTYGLAYHIADVLIEVQRLQHANSPKASKPAEGC
jgi:hypothetical protein